LASFNATTLQLNLSAQIATGQRLCHDGADAASGLQTIGDCSSTQSDLAEYYGSDGTLRPGDIVVPFGQAYQVITANGVRTSKAFVTKSFSPYQTSLIGIVSTNPFAEVLGEGVFDNSENRVPGALVGRVPVRVAPSSQAISPGDYLTTSSEPGLAMKATVAGPSGGKALEAWGPQQPKDTIMAFVNLTWYDPALALNEFGELSIAEASESTSSDSRYQILDTEYKNGA